MKNICINKYMVAVTTVIASLVSCTRIEEQEIPDVAPKVHMTFSADIEGNADTKTVLGGQMGDTYRKLLWEPQDSIGITSSLSNASFDKFVNIETSLSGVGTFEGSTTEGSTYYLFYPYSSTLSTKDGDKITFKLPSAQVYDENSFSSDAMPMVSKGAQGESYRFYSLGGVFALNLTGSEIVKSVSFTGKDASGNHLPVSGEFSVNMNYEEFPEIVAGETVSASVSLNCGEGVTLDPSKPTPFYMVLPVARYESFTIIVSTADGKVMMKEVNKTLDIKRANVTKTASLAYVASETINLSESGWANCYVVSNPGIYSFDATVIGNGDFGMIEDAGFHTISTSIAPASAEIVWEDVPGAVTMPSFDGKRINFMASGIEGNALVAAKNAEGTIVWSWHVWVTDKPAEQIYENSLGSFTVLDRNLGATRADRGTGDEWLESRGLAYFWGRKDPFWYGNYTHTDNEWMTVLTSVANPNMRHRTGTWWHGTSSWSQEHHPYLWTADLKTIYDPCPIGYKVAVSDVWEGFTGDAVAGTFDNGWNFYIDGAKTSTAWYPANYWMRWGSGHEFYTEQGGVWASDYTSNSTKMYFYYEPGGVQTNATAWDGYGVPVRCMKDEGHVDLSLPQVDLVSFSDITETSAKVVANVVSEGASELTERGIIWGSEPDLSDGTKVNCGKGIGQYSLNLTDLAPGTMYYARAYAVNDKEEVLSSIKAFSTIYENSDVINLSKYSTSNSYIVSSPGVYIINGLVKGNSVELVGVPASTDVIWETNNTDVAVNSGSIITSLKLQGGYVSFEVPAPLKQGNALIAVRDESGTILWSWHIWVADFNPDLTIQTYYSGAKMMDRNLGALSIAENDALAYGLLYQWGRKDPYVNAYNTSLDGFAATCPEDAITFEKKTSENDKIGYSVANPSVVVNDMTWNRDTQLWGKDKTMYDPCPVGWKVPDGGPGAWLDFNTNDRYGGGGVWFDKPLAIPSAYYPNAGFTDGDNILKDRNSAHYWSSTLSEDKAYNFCINWRGIPDSKSSTDCLFSVRCEKDDHGLDVKTVEIVAESDSEASVLGFVTVDTGYILKETGVVVSTLTEVPTLEDCHVRVVSDKVESGAFECVITGILGRTKYFVRTYAISEKGVTYGNVMEYMVRTSGSGEGFTGDDFVWE